MNKKNRACAKIGNEINESVIQSIEGEHNRFGRGWIGMTDNYIYFLPNKSKEDSLIINCKYLDSYGYQMTPTGDFFTSDTIGNMRITREVSYPTFDFTGKSDDATFGYMFIIPDLPTGKKLYKALKKNPNTPKERVEKRKFM